MGWRFEWEVGDGSLAGWRMKVDQSRTGLRHSSKESGRVIATDWGYALVVVFEKGTD